MIRYFEDFFNNQWTSTY